MTLVVQPGLAQPSPAQASLQQSGWVLLCVSPPSVASARPSRYELCIMHPEEEVWKAETLSQPGVYRLIARGSTDRQLSARTKGAATLDSVICPFTGPITYPYTYKA